MATYLIKWSPTANASPGIYSNVNHILLLVPCCKPKLYTFDLYVSFKWFGLRKIGSFQYTMREVSCCFKCNSQDSGQYTSSGGRDSETNKMF